MHPPPNTAQAALAAVRQAQTDQIRAETAQLEHILVFTRHYRVIRADTNIPVVAGMERLIDFGGDGTPRLAEFCVLELAAALGVPEESAFMLIAQTLDLAHRHPQLWQQVRDHQLRTWIARRLVDETRQLPKTKALQVDAELADVAAGMNPGRLFRLARALVLKHTDPEKTATARDFDRSRRGVWFDQAVHDTTTFGGSINAADALRLDAQLNQLAAILAAGGDAESLNLRRAKALGILAAPARALQLLQASLLDQGLPELPEIWDTTSCSAVGQPGHSCGTITTDPDKLLPRTNLVVHLTDTTLAAGEGIARAEKIGPVLAGWLTDLTANSRIHVRPVLKVDSLLPADSYEVPDAMREAINLRNPVSVFPHANRTSRGLDLDHTDPYRWDGTAGQTHTGNLGPLTRRPHRAKTHAGWKVTQPWPGIYTWTSPLGYGYLTTPSHTWLIHDPNKPRQQTAAAG